MPDSAIPIVAAFTLAAVVAQAALHIRLMSLGVYLADRDGTEKQSTALQKAYSEVANSFEAENRVRDRFFESTEIQEDLRSTGSLARREDRPPGRNNQDRHWQNTSPNKEFRNPMKHVLESRVVPWLAISILLVISLILGW